MNSRVLPEAEAEALAAAAWYDERRSGLGELFLVELGQAFHTIRTQPQLMSRLEKYAGPHTIRRQLLSRFPYAVIVLQRDAELLVVAIAHTPPASVLLA